MASIQTREKNGKPSHTVKIRVKGSPPVFKTFPRLTDARNWAQKTESDIREGLYFKKHESRKHTLKELIKRYTEEILPHKPKGIDRKSRYLFTYLRSYSHTTFLLIPDF